MAAWSPLLALAPSSVFFSSVVSREREGPKRGTMRVLITGASRGIGAAVARAFARKHGADAQICLLARSLDSPSHTGLDGTLARTAREVEAHGALALPLLADVRDATTLQRTMQAALHAFGGLDVLVNNASALWVPEDDGAAWGRSPADKLDLVHSVNARATLLGLDACRDALEASRGSVVTLSPPIRLGRLEWIARHPAYTLSKYNMTLATLAYATASGVRANCLWPKRTVATAATWMLEQRGGVEGAFSRGRSADDVAEAVHELAVGRPELNARALYDEEVLPRRRLARRRRDGGGEGEDDVADAPYDACVEPDGVARWPDV